MSRGKDALSDLPAGLTALLTRAMEDVFGPAVDAPAFGPVSWADLGATLCFVLFFLPVYGLAAAFVRRKVRQALPDKITGAFVHNLDGAHGLLSLALEMNAA